MMLSSIRTAVRAYCAWCRTSDPAKHVEDCPYRKDSK